jgi:hypothetical protein
MWTFIEKRGTTILVSALTWPFCFLRRMPGSPIASGWNRLMSHCQWQCQKLGKSQHSQVDYAYSCNIFCGFCEVVRHPLASDNPHVEFIVWNLLIETFQSFKRWNLFYITLHVLNNIGHLHVSLKLLMKLLCFHPWVQFMGYILICVPMCPMVMGCSLYCVVCSCYVLKNKLHVRWLMAHRNKWVMCSRVLRCSIIYYMDKMGEPRNEILSESVSLCLYVLHESLIVIFT